MFVYRITDLSTGQTENDPVDFEGVIVNTDSSYETYDASFTAADDGNYFMGKECMPFFNLKTKHLRNN